MRTMDGLRELGFEAAAGQSLYGLRFNFGSFELDAAESMNRHLVEVVMLTGIAVTRRPSGQASTMTDIQFEMPREIESCELCAAWIVWHLDSHGITDVDPLPMGAEWVDEGRRHINLLPWKVEQAAYAARPQCAVARDWLKIALRELSTRIADLPNEELVTLRYRDGMLEFRLNGRSIPLPGEGATWKREVSIAVGSLRHLPNRLMHDVISISVWDGRLIVGNRSLPLAS